MTKISTLIGRFPLITFVVALLVLFLVIQFAAKQRNSQAPEAPAQKQIREVNVYDASEIAYTSVLAEVDRADSITLIATASGIVTEVLADGEVVEKGARVAQLSDTYAGTSSAAANAALAQTALNQQRTLYTEQEKLYEYQEDEVAKTDDVLVKIERKQIDLQERSNEFSLETARLQANQAYANAALYKTVAPFGGVVQESLVRVGDSVSPGQPLTVLKASDAQPSQLVAYVGSRRAASIDISSDVTTVIDGREVNLQVVHIARAPSRSGSYAVTMEFDASGVLAESVGDGDFVEVKLPLASSVGVLAPIDALRYTVDGVEIYVATDGMAHAIPVTVGTVYGNFVEIVEGLTVSQQIILDRTIADQEPITIKSHEGAVSNEVTVSDIENTVEITPAVDGASGPGTSLESVLE